VKVPAGKDRSLLRRRDVLIGVGAALATPAAAIDEAMADPRDKGACNTNAARAEQRPNPTRHEFNGPYQGEFLDHVAFPMGGLGAGMVCLEGAGALSHVSVRNHPDVFNEPCMFAAIAIRGAKSLARVLEGPVPGWKLFGGPRTGLGMPGPGPSPGLDLIASSLGLPRFAEAQFECRFPFGTVRLRDERVPLDVDLCAWSPFTPGDADNSSLPFAALEYRLTNRTGDPIEAVFSFNSVNFMIIPPTTPKESGARAQAWPNAVLATPGGFVLWGAGSAEKPWEEGWFSVAAQSEKSIKVNHVWFRGNGFDPITMAWRDIESAACFDRPPVTDDPSPGASLFVPVALAPGATQTIKLRLCWYAPKSSVGGKSWLEFSDQTQPPADGQTHRPWYAGRFTGIEELSAHWAANYDSLRQRTEKFSDCFYDTTLPPEVIEAVAANLAILKSPTVLRQADGRMWAWEGCQDDAGSCFGSCTHVWNYAQAVAHLFPSLERTLRETEFGPSQDDSGFQAHRSALPIRVKQALHEHPPAADGQLGGIMKVYRDWRISGNTPWLREWWPKVRESLEYCISTWDPDRKGWLEEPHLNTYDIWFWGPNGMCSSIYLGALAAAAAMGNALGDETNIYRKLYEKGVARVERELFNGEYFVQKIEWKNLRAIATHGPPESPIYSGSPERKALEEREGPSYQYGTGCLSDGVIGAWFARVCGVEDVLDNRKVTAHLMAVHRHNWTRDLSTHANPQRPGYALGREGGLLLCSWPDGHAPSLPFIYSNEVWTGIEYQVASHLMMVGAVQEGLDVVRTCRARYDGRIRNPFDEYECGHWYGRALASYALLQGLSGARYDAIDKVLHLRPAIKGDFRCFIATASGFGTVGVKNGQPFLEVVSGDIPCRQIKYSAA
jgi:Glycosyl-hydrolase family 116, catalytic region/beta-glucosidase 2, glycosyl-hydrolase family 116 N-term